MLLKSFLKNNLLHTLHRFDLTIVSSVLLTILALSNNPDLKPDINMPIMAFGIIWFISSKLWIESTQLPRKYFYVLSMPIFFVFAYSLNFSYWYIIPYCGLLTSILLAPFISKTSTIDDMWTFSFEVLKGGLYAGTASIVLLAGIDLILLALDYLLSFKIYADQYIDLAKLTVTFVFPLLAISGIPTRFNTPTLQENGKLLLKLMLIVIPLLLLYGIILHLYIAKILIAQSLPRGKVAYLAGGFSSITLMVYMLTQRWRHEHNIIRSFHRTVAWFMVLPLALMAFAIWKRVSLFGLTEARYLLALLWAWMTASTISVLIRTSHPIKWILGSLNGLLLISIITPLSLQDVSIKHQMYRLKTVLSHIKSSKKADVSKGDKIIVSAIIDYLAKHNRLDDVYALSSTNKDTLEPPRMTNSDSKLSPKTVGALLGVEYLSYEQRRTPEISSFFEYNRATKPISIQGYMYLISDVVLSSHDLKQTIDINELGAVTVAYSPSTYYFEIYQGQRVIYRLYMPDLIYKLPQNQNDTLRDDLLTDAQEQNGIRVIFNRLVGELPNAAVAPKRLPLINVISVNILLKRSQKAQ